jgi:hypothetical protein
MSAKLINDVEFANIIREKNLLEYMIEHGLDNGIETDRFRVEVLKNLPFRVKVTDTYFHDTANGFSIEDALNNLRKRHMNEIESRIEALRKIDRINEYLIG